MSNVFENLLAAAKEYRDNSDAHIGSTGRPLDDAIEAAERETESVPAELAELERWRTLFGCDDPQDAIYTTCDRPAARVLQERQAEIRRLEAELTRMREFEDDIRFAIGRPGMQYIYDALEDLDRKRGEHE